jgi:hypothetical protein
MGRQTSSSPVGGVVSCTRPEMALLLALFRQGLPPFGMTMVHVSAAFDSGHYPVLGDSLDGHGGDRPPWDRTSSPLP